MMTPASQTALRILLTGIVDYAGLFPPASLTMSEAIANYHSYSDSSSSWMLGRFIVPSARLEEFTEIARTHFHPGGRLWKISMLASTDVNSDITRISQFNKDHLQHAAIDVIELKATPIVELRRAFSMIPNEITAYVEVPIDDDPSHLITSIAHAGARAKVRTGGTTQEMFPSPRDIARFIAVCVREAVPFKATAGLHHPLRSCYRLTYKDDSPKGLMYGFLNVFLAAAFIEQGMEQDTAIAVLEEQSPEAFRFRDDFVEWRSNRISNDELTRTRKRVAISFGSCSFQEPVDDLQTLHLL